MVMWQTGGRGGAAGSASNKNNGMDTEANHEARATLTARARATPTARARTTLTARAIETAHSLGFDMAGVVTDPRSGHMDAFRQWLARGLHGTMGYLARSNAVKRRGDLRLTLDGFRSALVVAHAYGDDDRPQRTGAAIPAGRMHAHPSHADPSHADFPHGDPPYADPPHGDPSCAVIARYARGRDYHHLVRDRLETLARRLEDLAGEAFRHRAYVDTGPILERELAKRAGLGWFGKNTMLIHPRRGSYFFLGVLLTDLPLAASTPFRDDHCGICQRCLDGCPTGALLGRDANGAPVMDATRCISYLTIETRGPIPHELRPAIGNRVFGCDICQEVCPWNAKFASPNVEPAYDPRSDLNGPRLIDLATRLLDMSGKEFLRQFRDSPVSRARRNGLLRNVCVALGNWGDPTARPPLERAARDRSHLVREHARWALARVDARRGAGGTSLP